MPKPPEEHIDHEGDFSMGGILRDKLHIVKGEEDPNYPGDNPKDDEQTAAEIKKRAFLMKNKSLTKNESEPELHVGKLIPKERAEAITERYFDFTKGESPRDRTRKLRELWQTIGLTGKYNEQELRAATIKDLMEGGLAPEGLELEQSPDIEPKETPKQKRNVFIANAERLVGMEVGKLEGDDITVLQGVLNSYLKHPENPPSLFIRTYEKLEAKYAGSDPKSRRNLASLQARHGAKYQEYKTISQPQDASEAAWRAAQDRKHQILRHSKNVQELTTLVNKGLSRPDLTFLAKRAEDGKQWGLLELILQKERDLIRHEQQYTTSPQHRQKQEQEIGEIGSRLNQLEEQKPRVDLDAVDYKAAQVTLARTNKYSGADGDLHPLYAATEKEGDEKFKEVTRKVWKEFVVHGLVNVSPDGKVTIRNKTDLDGRAVAGLLVRAGFDISNVEYVAAGESKKGKINIDTGNQDGFVIEEEGKTAYIDHHTTISGRENSATKVAYEILTKLGLLERSPELDKIVEFVTHGDNMTYPNEEYGTKSARTMFGLRKNLSFAQLEILFKNGKDALTPLSDQEMKKIIVSKAHTTKDGRKFPMQTLFDKSKERLTAAKDGQRELGKMAQEGLVIDSKEYGSIVVDINGKVKTGGDAAKASGAGMFILWMPESKSFFVSTLTSTPLKHKFGQGIPVRDTMWIKPRNDESPLTVKLSEVLAEVAGPDFKPTRELKAYIERVEQGVDSTEAIDPLEKELSAEEREDLVETMSDWEREARVILSEDNDAPAVEAIITAMLPGKRTKFIKLIKE